jgi:hypothetical protein
MTDALATLAWKLASLSGLQVYPAPKPEGASLPCLTYQVISDPMQDHNHSAGASIHKTRVQISHIGNYETARPLVTTIQNGLEGNKTDFSACLSDGIYFERYEGEDIWSLIKGYFIQWKA